MSRLYDFLPGITAAVILMLTACGGGGGTGPPTDAGPAPADVADQVTADGVIISPQDVLTDGPKDLVLDLDAEDTDVPADFDSVDAWVPVPCQSHDDCADGFCIEIVPDSDEYVCTVTCIEECPLDWVCKSVFLDGADPVSICMPPGDTLCRACQTDVDCLLAGSLCIKSEGTLGFCGRTCNPDGSLCPEGFECVLYTDPDGQAQGHQCLPVPGSCCVANEWVECNDDNPCTFDSCNPSLGCTHEPTEDECSGDEPCTLYECIEGECVGEPITSDDTLDGIDSDCDGSTDEDAYKEFRLVTGQFAACGGQADSDEFTLIGVLGAPPIAGATGNFEWTITTGLMRLLALAWGEEQ
jgi:hypothetical protein